MKREFDRFLSLILIVFFVFSAKVSAAPGDLDTTFAGSGYVRTILGPADNAASATLIQPDGKIVAVGAALIDSGNTGDATVVRYDSSGVPDPSFDGDGIVYTSLGGTEGFFAVALQADGKIVAAGQAQLPGIPQNFMVARYNPNGSLDTTFDGDGIVTTDIANNGRDLALAVAIQPDGKIIVVGRTELNSEWDFAIARYNADGSLDTAFDGDGIVVKSISGGTADKLTSVALQLDGKIIVLGDIGGAHAVLRYNPNGSLDTGFDSDGIVTGFASAGSMGIQWDGKIVVSGTASSDFAVLRYNSNGSLDTSFDFDGSVVTNISGASNDTATSLALQSDGKIIAAGYSTNIASQAVFSVVRYNADGSLDNSWGSGGKVFTDFPGTQDNGEDVVSSPDGKIIVSGYMSGFGLARYQASPAPATAKISGRVVNSQGRGISGARVSLSGATGGMKIIQTNPFGYYNFPNLATGTNYTVSVLSKRSQFYQNARSVQLSMDVLGLHFIGTP